MSPEVFGKVNLDASIKSVNPNLYDVILLVDVVKKK